MSRAAKVTVVEVEEVVENGEIPPSLVDVPHIYVHRVVHCPKVEKRIEVRSRSRSPIPSPLPSRSRCLLPCALVARVLLQYFALSGFAIGVPEKS